MLQSSGRFLVLTLAMLACACAAAGTPGERGGSGSVNRDVITREELFRYTNAYEAINALRPAWLRARGTDSLTNPSQVWVYIDGSRLGGVGTLRTVTAGDVAEIRFYDGLAATQRWGMDHGAGVIAITTRIR